MALQCSIISLLQNVYRSVTASMDVIVTPNQGCCQDGDIIVYAGIHTPVHKISQDNPIRGKKARGDTDDAVPWYV
jgi:hypothetical protein